MVSEIGNGVQDNFVIPFHLEKSDVRGRFIRLSLPLNHILDRHQYPESVSRLLGEAVLITALIGSGLKGSQRVTLQAKGDGAIRLLVADYFGDGSVRGYADFDKERLKRWTDGEGADQVNPFLYLGQGYLALTLEHADDKHPYQGIVALDGVSLTGAVMKYMEQSDQLLSSIRLCLNQKVDEVPLKAANDNPTNGAWFGAAMLLQKLGHSGEEAKIQLNQDQEALWDESKLFFKTISDEELTDISLPPQQLLYRLFNELDVHTYQAQSLKFGCTCSAEKIEAFIKSSETDQVYDMVQNGKITATCQFCSSEYVFDPKDYGMTL